MTMREMASPLLRHDFGLVGALFLEIERPTDRAGQERQAGRGVNPPGLTGASGAG
jgi:hypothetical protein